VKKYPLFTTNLHYVNNFLRQTRNKGYKYSTAFCVSPTATRAFNKQGYVSIKDIKYSEFECNGSKPFSILPDYLSIMVKELS
jgi:hypothetical protein